MGRYLLKRLLLIVPTIAGILVLVFVLVRVVPGDPATVLESGPAGETLERGADRSRAARLFIERHGLDQPLATQLARWLGGLLRIPPDFGVEFATGRPVLEEMGRRLAVSIPLGGVSLALSCLIAIPLGIVSALRRGRTGERLLTTSLFVSYSIPTFWAGSLLILLFCNQGLFNLFPLLGLTSDDFHLLSLTEQLLDIAWHAVLPIACLTYGSVAYLARQMRSSLLEALHQDYVRTARAKGLSARGVVIKHALRNSLLPILTLLGSMLPFLVAGSVIVESLFEIPGIGRYAWQGFLSRDYNIVMGTTTLSAVVTLLGLLLSDISYALVDPRIRYDRA
ncbi:MAG: ABC transporter permease [Planctomycetota bacterium]